MCIIERGCIRLWAIGLRRNLRVYWLRKVLRKVRKLRLYLSSLRGAVQHWMHIRTTNPIESTFATVRLRTKRTKGCGSRKATLTMVFKLAQEA
jgi:transposase-like protein